MIITKSIEETHELGKKIASKLNAGDVLLLDGDMGTGKSELARGIAKGLGVTDIVTSPSFTILQLYETGRLPLYHFDWYRINSVDELYELSMEEYLGGDGVALIEWFTRCEEVIPKRHLRIKITSLNENERSFTFFPMGGFLEGIIV